MQLNDLAGGLLDCLVPLLHWVAGFIVLAEGLNKLERTAPLAPDLTCRQRAVVLLKVAAWILLVLAAAGALARPLVVVAIGLSPEIGAFPIVDRVSLADLCGLLGFAVLVVRSRLKEDT